MANPWDSDEVVQAVPTSAASAMPWEQDEVVPDSDFDDDPSRPALQVEIVGGKTQAQRDAESARPSLFRMDSDFQDRTGVGNMAMLGAAARDMFGTGTAEYLAGKVNEKNGLSSLITGGAKVERTPEGDELLVLQDGTSYRLNDDGLDSTDVANFTGNALAFFTPAAWASRFNRARNLGLAGRMATQAGVAGATDVALQAAVSQGEVDPMRTAATVVGGAGGEVVGTGLNALARRGVNTFNNVTGRTTQAAQDELRRQGAQVTPEATRQMAQRLPDIQAGASPNAVMGAQRYGFEYTQGQRATDPAQQFRLLSEEEVLRQSPAGGQVLRDAAARNADRLGNALSERGEALGAGVGANPADLAGSAANRLQGQARALDDRIADAYQTAGQAGRAAISTDAIAGLPQILRTSVADFAPNATTTPVTSRTLSQIQEATASLLAREPGEAGVAGVTLKALETQRRILNNNINAATNNADRAAMVKLKREFDGWMDEAVDTALISGDANALKLMKEARALRAEYGRRFEGNTDSDRFIAGLLDGSRTPEELVNIALGASQVSKAGGARFINRLAQAADGDPEVIGNLRGAHFLRLTRGNNGEPLQMGQIIRNIKSTEYNNASIVKALYSPAEWAEVKRLADALDPLVAKGDFARTSGTAERMARMLFSRMGGGLPLIGDMVRGVGEGVNVVRAQNALNRPLPLPRGGNPAANAAGAATFQDGSR